MQSHLRIWRYFHWRRLLSLCLPLVLAAMFFGSGLGSDMLTAYAQSSCSRSASSAISANASACASDTTLGNASHHTPSKGHFNPFPHGSCTWWADQRYFQLHGFYVPWTTQAMAWQWPDRASQFYWRVSTRPSPGAIIDLQPWVQWAWGSGHVGVVEKVLKNGHVIASNMSWWPTPWRITNAEFRPGPGVTFISFN